MYRLLNNVFDFKEAFVDFREMRCNYDGLKVWFNEDNDSLNNKLKSKWLPVGVKFDASCDAILKNKSPAPDLSIWNMSCLVISDRALSVLKEMLEKYGEVFPLKDGFHLFNCLESVGNETIDGEKSAFEMELSHNSDLELLGTPTKLSLINSKIKNKAIFKPGFSGNSFLICQDAFKTLVEENKLGGLLFEKDLAQMFPSEHVA